MQHSRSVPPGAIHGHSLYFETFNRGKRSIAIDLQTRAGQELLRRLVATVDIVFNNLRGDLKIKPLNVGFAAYYESAGRVDLMDNHKDEKPLFISGKEVRRCLLAGEPVDPRVMRESTAAILTKAMAGK